MEHTIFLADPSILTPEFRRVNNIEYSSYGGEWDYQFLENLKSAQAFFLIGDIVPPISEELKGKMKTFDIKNPLPSNFLIVTISKDGHTEQVCNTWDLIKIKGPHRGDYNFLLASGRGGFQI